MDIKSKEERSRNMSAIRSGDTKPEMLVRRYLHSQGFRYGLHNHKLPGSPDIVLRKYKTVIFINGCFWHVVMRAASIIDCPSLILSSGRLR